MSYKRKLEDDRRLRRLYKETKNHYGPGAWYSERKQRIIKVKIGTKNYKRFLKKTSSKKARLFFQNSELYQNKGYFKKTFDYWWNLY